jgi:hypothetical protein
MNKLEQFRYNVLEKLRQAFDSLDLAAVVRDPAEGLPTHILNVLHTDIGGTEEEVMGEYYFLPVADENAKFHLFTSMLTLTEDMPENKYDELGRAVNLLNFFLPVGAFVFSKPEKIMAFKYTSLIPMGFSEDETINSIDGNIGLSLQMVNQYTEVLLKLMQDEITFEDFLDELPDAFQM